MYQYRGDNLRHNKWVGGVNTTYTWDVQLRLPVILQDGSYTYVYGHSLISQTDSGGAQTYFLGNALGSTEALTDGSGTVTGTRKYDAFGAVRSSTGTGSTEYEFTGQQSDATLGYTYLRARYYDPAVGRFISKDPMGASLGNPATENKYAYASVNPVSNTDPTGLLTYVTPDGRYTDSFEAYTQAFNDFYHPGEGKAGDRAIGSREAGAGVSRLMDTGGLCLNITIGVLGLGTASFCAVRDDDGNNNITVTVGGAASTGAAVGVTVGPQYTNAPNNQALAGPQVSTGMNGPGWSWDAFAGQDYQGVDAGAGPNLGGTAPFLPVEYHGGAGYTWVFP